MERVTIQLALEEHSGEFPKPLILLEVLSEDLQLGRIYTGASPVERFKSA